MRIWNSNSTRCISKKKVFGSYDPPNPRRTLLAVEYWKDHSSCCLSPRTLALDKILLSVLHEKTRKLGAFTEPSSFDCVREEDLCFSTLRYVESIRAMKRRREVCASQVSRWEESCCGHHGARLIVGSCCTIYRRMIFTYKFPEWEIWDSVLTLSTKKTRPDKIFLTSSLTILLSFTLTHLNWRESHAQLTNAVYLACSFAPPGVKVCLEFSRSESSL